MSVMKKQFMKVRQIADQTFLRTDKTEVLSKELEAAEKRLEALKQPCHVLYKKMLACHQGAAQEPTEKRKKRMPEIQLSNSMHEFLGTDLEGNTLLWQVLEGCSVLQSSLAEALLDEQVQAEKEVLSTLHEFLEVDIPNVLKLRKQLFKLSQDMDSARTRYESSVRHFQQATGPAQTSAHTKAEGCREELEELTMKVEQARDTYAAELYSLVSREPFICQSFVQWYEMQAAYHNKCLELLNSRTPALQKLIDKSNHRPLYGYSLEDHLQCTGREIALVLEACICCLVETAINEEGLFRIAGSASKVKKLKNALDAGVTNMFEYALEPHTVAGALKSYLRALPEPLMTYATYDDWIQADRITDSDARLQRLWQVLNGLPKANYNNLRYLVKFLHCLCKNSEHNKMSSQNLSIVMSPNLLWSPASQQSNHIGLNMSAANAHSCIVDTLINYCDWFFPDDVVFRLTMPAFPSPKGLLTPPILEDSGGSSSPTSIKGIVNTAFEGANGESDESLGGQSPRVIHRPGKKPAPPVPLVLDTAVEPQVLSRTSPPSQVGPPEHPISRSATLDRPGKPKRAPTRKSHDNLASLLPLEGLQQNSNQQGAFQFENSTACKMKAEPTVQSSSQSLTNQKEFSQGIGTSHLSIVKERSQERANWFLGENHSLRKEAVSQSVGSGLDHQLENEKDKAQLTAESLVSLRDGLQPQSDNSLGIQNNALQHTVPCNKVEDVSGSCQVSDNQKPRSLAETRRKEVVAGTNQSPERQDVNCGSPDVPFARAATGKDAVIQPQNELYAANQVSSIEPIYENVSSQIKKEANSTEPCFQEMEAAGPVSQEKHIVQAEISSSLSMAENQGPLPHKEQKPHVPCKPVALSIDRSAQDTSTQVRPKENNLPQEDDGAKESGGDRWQFLTSTHAVDRIPERPPKVGPTEGPSEGPEDKRPSPAPASVAKVKPPRPQPPLPPSKPRLSTDAEDTRL